MLTRFSLAIAAMTLVVVSSNFLVQYPVQMHLGDIDLAEILTWGAFTYPIAFLVNDFTNRYFGVRAARIVVLVGFAIAVVLSVFLATPRIAVASGSAFLVAQLLDTVLFDRMRASAWWKAPLISSLLGSILDTALFFTFAFSVDFAFIDQMFGTPDGSLGFAVPFLSVGVDVPLWVSLAVGDFIVKLAVALVMLVPYGLLRGRISDRVLHPSAD